MNFFTQQTEVCQQANLDITDATTLSNVQRWLNIAQQDITSRWPWEFLKSREVIQTVADKSAGTVAIISGGTTVTGTSTAFASTDVGSFIQFGTNDWYKITAFASATSITIEAPYVGTTNYVAGGYIVRKYFYSLSASADSILDIRNWDTPIKLVELNPNYLDDAVPNPQSTGPARNYVVFGVDASGNIQITPYPFPNDVRNIEIRTIRRATDLSANTDTSIIPSKWHHVMIFGANYLAFMFLRKSPIAEQWKKEYEEKIEDMIHKERMSEDELPVLNPIDKIERTNWLRFPDGYPLLR